MGTRSFDHRDDGLVGQGNPPLTQESFELRFRDQAIVTLIRWEYGGRRDNSTVIPVNEANEFFRGKQIVRKRFAGKNRKDKRYGGNNGQICVMKFA